MKDEAKLKVSIASLSKWLVSNNRFLMADVAIVHYHILKSAFENAPCIGCGFGKSKCCLNVGL